MNKVKLKLGEAQPPKNFRMQTSRGVEVKTFKLKCYQMEENNVICLK